LQPNDAITRENVAIDKRPNKSALALDKRRKGALVSLEPDETSGSKIKEVEHDVVRKPLTLFGIVLYTRIGIST
jgi:hypothetical protein